MTAPDQPTADRRELLKNAFGAIEQLKARVRSLEAAAALAAVAEPIAIVGAGCRFPGGANGLDAYWAVLDEGRDVITEIPASRWETVGDASAEPGWHAGLVDDIDGFDPRFFGISAREATTMDPQQRMVLEVAWEALENAGLPPDRLAGSLTGVFLGITGHDYADLLHDAGGLLDVYAATGNANNAAAGRLSFLLGLQGPSLAVDTACSSSLVAIHLACTALRAGDCRTAIAGGVNALLSSGPFVCFRSWGMMTADGHCKTFDSRADGFVRGEGCGMIVLKRLSDAEADGDRVLAVIRGSAVNQDGRSSGLTVPNGPAQEAVIARALAVAGLDPRDVGYMEAHGTGTSLGDPIEAHVMAAALGAGRTADNPLVVGSVKTNLGHFESAAGVAGLLKVVLSLQHERIPAHLHFREMNPDIDWAGVPVEIPVAGKAWTRGERARIAGVSSFGFSGTNAHVIIEEAPPAPERAADPRAPHLFTLSARTEAARDALADRVAASLGSGDASLGDATLGDVCHTANTGRAQLAERVAVVAATREELREKLLSRSWIAGQAKAGRRVAFLFTGQGSQWAGMGRELYESEPVFRAALDRCAAVLDGLLAHPLLDVLYGAETARLDETAYTQPALFAVEWALAELWKSWGIEPAAVLGHSVGEYVALCVAGVWTLEDGLKLIAERGRLMQSLGGGWGMSAVQASRAVVEASLGGLAPWVSVAAANAPESVVISGRQAELAEAARRLVEAGVSVRPLTVSQAFHSAQMDGVAAEFARIAGRVTASEPAARVVSSVTGKFVDAAALADPTYWERQVRQAVEFQAGMETLAAAGYDTFVEVGPTATLTGLGRQSVGKPGQLWAPSLRRDAGAREQMLDSVGRLFVHGADVRWEGVDAAYPGRTVALPTYPFQRQRYWIDAAPRTVPGAAARATAGHPLLGPRITVAGPPETHVWQTTLGIDAFPYLADHRVQGSTIVPATVYIEMGVAAAHEVLGDGPVALTDARFHRPLLLGPGDAAHVQVSFAPSSGTLRVHGRADAAAPWTLLASAGLERAELPEYDAPPADPGAGLRALRGDDVYALLRERGNDFGPTFQGVARAWLGATDGWSEVVVPEALAGDVAQYWLHPAVADANGHVLAAITAAAAAEPAPVVLEVGERGQLDNLRWMPDTRTPPGPGQVEIRVEATGLNFRDVLGTLGLYPGDPGSLGGECAGVVTAVGAGVTDLAVGDEVLAFADRSFATYVLALAALTVRKPARLTFAEAATIPVAFLTADYALRQIGRIAAGDRVLVHAATGGVGMAATQLAKRAGATVVGTAGNPEKRAIARAIGADHVSDSRSLAFADDVMTATDGEGVDIVLNSLAGDFIPKSLGVLRAGGRFIEIGKTGIWDQAAVSAAYPGVEYAVLYLGEIAATNPALLQTMLRDLVAGFEAGTLTPLPQAIYPAEQMVDAFRFMAQAKHVGKVVVRAAQPVASGRSFVGQSFDRVCVYERPQGRRLRAHGWITPSTDPAVLRGDVRVFDESGRLVSEIRGVQMRAMASDDMDVGESAIPPASRWYHQLAWTPSPWTDTPDAPAAPGPWLVVQGSAPSAAQAALAAALVAAMRADGVDAAIASDDRLDALGSSSGGRTPAGVVSLAGLDAGPSDGASLGGSTGAASLLALMRTVAGRRLGRLWVVTRGVHAADGPASPASVWQAPLWGLGRAQSVEDAPTWGGLVDLDANAAAADSAAALWRHLRAPAGEDQVALRGGRRLALRLEALEQPPAAPIPVRADGAYLVTGGLGGLGLEVARWLARRGARHLVLWGRSAFPPREGWASLPANHAMAAAVAAIREIERDGATVDVASVDVSDASAVHAALAARTARGAAPVAGVMHAAGVVAQRSLADLTPAELELTLAPKLGAWLLHDSLGSQLDFFVTFSSASALRPPPGLGAYAAANAFLDALAHARRGAGQPALSVNWGAWGEVGMAARDGVESVADRGMGAMRTEEGLDALGRLLASPLAQAAVLPVNWRRVAERYASYASTPMFASLVARTASPAAAPVAGSVRERLRDAADDERAGILVEYLRGALGAILGFAASDLDPHVPVSALGIDSLTAVELRNRIGADVGVALGTVRVLRGPTIAELAAEIEPLLERAAEPAAAAAPDDAELLGRLDEMSDAEVEAALAELMEGGAVE